MSDSKKLKSRRSSILKPPKPRNPLSDVDLNPSSEIISKSRRVSFANVHFKKEFTADPEKNTIWHNSYEEEMNKSDKSDHSEAKNSVTSNEEDINMSIEMLETDVMNCTQMMSFDSSLEAILTSNSLETSITSATIDLTEHHNNKGPMLSSLQMHPHFQEVDHSYPEVAIAMTEIADVAASIINKENYQQGSAATVKNQNKNRRTINFKTSEASGDMDITQAASVKIAENENQCSTKRQTIYFTEETEGANIEITQPIPSNLLFNLQTNIAEQENQCSTKRQTIHFTDETEGATMELTKSVPSHILHLIKNNPLLQNQTINFKSSSESANMDLTDVMSEEIENVCATKRQTIYYNETEGATMELTHSIPAHIRLNLTKKHQAEKRQTVNFKNSAESGNMDVTQGLTIQIHEKENQFVARRQTIHFNETEGATMEFTQTIPSDYLSNLNKIKQSQNRQTINYKSNPETANIDSTETVAVDNSEKENQCARKRQTIHFDNETEGATMELTHSIPSHERLNLNTKHQPEKRQTINFKTGSGGNMDITQGLTAQIYEKEKQFGARRQTIHYNNETEGATMEFTQAIPSDLFSNLNKMKQSHNRQTINFKSNSEAANMDLTEAVAVDITDKENQCAKKRQTIYFDNETEGATMELTHSIPSHERLNSNTKHQTDKRQTINFKTGSGGNMDITQGLTAQIHEKENQFGARRQTIHYNNETEGATMEFTQAIPSDLLSNLNKMKQSHNRQTINFKSNSEAANMDLTEAVAVDNSEKENQCAKKRQTIYFDNETEGATMELTHSTPSHERLNLNTKHQTDKRQTINFKTSSGGNMDITQGLTAQIHEKENQFGARRQTIHYNNETEGATMEFTQAIPSDLLSNLNQMKQSHNRQTINFKSNSEAANMDLTEAVAVDNSEKENQCARKRQTIYFDNETEGAKMELTHSIPSHEPLNLNTKHQPDKRQTINFKTGSGGNMDITQGLTAQIHEKENQFSARRQTIHYNNETEGATMELTQAIPSDLVNLYKMKQQNRQTIHFKSETANMDLTEAVAVDYSEKENQESTKRQTIHFNNETMEYTQTVPPNLLLNLNKCHQTQNRQSINMELTQAAPNENVDKENQCSRKRKIIHSNNDIMEFTHSVPSHVVLNQHKTRQTINFNTTAEDGNMEITQGLTAEIMDKENQCTTRRQTVYYNNESKGAAMEFTQEIPPQLLLNKNNQRRQTINFKDEAEGATMEITQPIPSNVVLNQNRYCDIQQSAEKMNFKQAVPIEIAEKENQCPSMYFNNDVKQNRQTINIKSNSETGSMDLTQGAAVDSSEKENMCVRNLQTIYTHSNTKHQTEKRQTINFKNSSEGGNMDITQGLTTQIHDKENQWPVRRQTIHFNNETDGATMEFTQSIPSNLNLNQNTNRHTHLGGTNAETLIAEKENQCCIKRETIHFNATQSGKMEITQLVPTHSSLNDRQILNENVENTNENAAKRQKMHYSNETDQNVDATCQTNHFIVETEDATIEITQSLPKTENTPANLLQKSLQISKVIQDTLNFTNMPKGNDSSSIKTVETYFPESSETVNNPQTNTQNEEIGPHSISGNPNSAGSDESEINLNAKLDLTPVSNENSFNLTKNLTLILDSTNKLLNSDPDLPVSEYSKIFLEAMDKNYSIANTDFPDNIEVLDITDNSNDVSHNRADSIISVNSSVEIDKSLSEIEQILRDVKPPPQLDFNFNLEEELFKIQSIQITSEENKQLIKNLTRPYVSVKERVKKYLNIDLDRFNKEKNDTMSLIYPQHYFEDKEPRKMYQKFQELVNKKYLAQEENQKINKEVTLEDKIKRMINKDTLWNLVPNEEFSFTFMGNSIKFVAQVDRDSQVVEHVEFFPQIDESTCRPIWIYIHRIQKLKLSESQIKAAIGQNYTIFTLLDYLTKIGEDLMDILQEYQHIEFNIGVSLDRNLNASLLFTNFFLRLSFQVTINLNNLGNMSGDLISVKNLVGSADENALKRLVKFCPPGFSFLREYDRQVQDYLKVLHRLRQK